MQQEKYDKIDKMLLEYFEKEKKEEEKEVPISTRIAIQTAFEKKRKYVTKMQSPLRRLITLLTIFAVFFTSFAFAEELWRTINLIFTNSNEGINKAVENGYIQDIDMDFVECNGVKVKADHILMDDKNLNISLVYQYNGDMTDIQEITLDDILIVDEKENVLAYLSDNLESEYMLKSIGGGTERYAKQSQIQNEIKESIYVNTLNKKFPNSKKITIISKHVHIANKKQEMNINGEWKIPIEIDSIFEQREVIKYALAENEKVKNANIEVNNTCMKVEIEVNKNLVLDKLALESNEKTYYSTDISVEKIGDKNYVKIIAIFNLTKYEAEEECKLIIKGNSNEEMILKLKKKTS